MRIVGLITEYNPFHNGHQHHIEKALEITQADVAIVVMSGNFVQRGTPAIMPKHLRVEMALKSGAALILELPSCYATGSAEYFAYGAVSLLDKLGCVDSICFGSECGDIEVLKNLAKIIHTEPTEYKNYLNSYLKMGNTFPLARQLALKAYLKTDAFNKILSEPNNILGIEYLKALYKLNSKMKPYSIKRETSSYHDDVLREKFSSASAIRNELLKEDWDFAELYGQIPTVCMPLIKDLYKRRYPICENDFSLLLKYKLLKETKTSLTKYADVSEDLANRIVNRLNEFCDFNQFCQLLKTKEMTYTRISRALIHILLDIRVDDCQDIEYARILGFRKDKDFVLSLMKLYASIPLITKLGNKEQLSNAGKMMLEQDIYVSNLYESVVADKFKTTYETEYMKQIVIV